MNKRTINDVINDVTFYTNGKTKVLSTEYVSSHDKLLFQCGCGELFERTYEVGMRSKLFMCKKCTAKWEAELHRKPFEEVLKYIREHNCEYVSGEYVNEKSILTYRCFCGEVFQRAFACFMNGGNTCRKCSRERVRQSSIKYTPELAKAIFADYGFDMIGNYKTSTYPVLCKCSKGHECNLRLANVLTRQAGCKTCASEKQKGKNSFHYMNGNTKLIASIRDSLEIWKNKIAERYQYRCPITGQPYENCDVYHLRPLNEIMQEVFTEHRLNVSGSSQIRDFQNYDIFDTVKKEIIAAHTLDDGILISAGIHRLFHRLYGNNKETREDFDCFLKTYFNTSVDEIQNKYTT